MDVNFTKNINKLCLARINKTRVELKGMKSGDHILKLDAHNLAQMWDISIKQAKKTIMANIQNDVQEVIIPLVKWLRISQ